MTDLVRTKETLVKTRELLSDPKRWTQEAAARDRFGTLIPENHPEASSWCLLGGIRHVGGEDAQIGLAWHLNMTPFAIADYNNTHSHEEVMALLDTAIDHIDQELFSRDDDALCQIAHSTR